MTNPRDFSAALHALKAGQRITRTGWNVLAVDWVAIAEPVQG